MKKLFKIISFLIVFIVIFEYFNNMYYERFNSEYVKYKQYENVSDVDVVFLGTSELWVGIIPVVLWKEAGITSYNLGHSYKSTVTYYYELKHALNSHNPQIVALDFMTLFSDSTPQENEEIYRHTLYKIDDSAIKRELIKDIIRLDKEEALSYIFPVLRFHSMWSWAEDKDLIEKPTGDALMPDYKAGWRDYGDGLYCEPVIPGRTLTPELWEASKSSEPISELNYEYYMKIIDLCREKNVQLVAIIPPYVSRAQSHAAQWDVMRAFFEENNIEYFDYNNYEQVIRMGLDCDKDFHTGDHLNYGGAFKWCKVLAEDMDKKLELTDHRNDGSQLSKQFDEWYEEFNEKFYYD